MVRPSHGECRVAGGGGVELNTPFTELKGFTGSKPNKPIGHTAQDEKLRNLMLVCNNLVIMRPAMFLLYQYHIVSNVEKQYNQFVKLYCIIVLQFKVV